MKINWNEIKNNTSVIELEDFIDRNKRNLTVLQLLQLNVEHNRQKNNCNDLANAFVNSHVYRLAEMISEKGNLEQILNNMVKITNGILRIKRAKNRANKRWGVK